MDNKYYFIFVALYLAYQWYAASQKKKRKEMEEREMRSAEEQAYKEEPPVQEAPPKTQFDVLMKEFEKFSEPESTLFEEKDEPIEEEVETAEVEEKKEPEPFLNVEGSVEYMEEEGKEESDIQSQENAQAYLIVEEEDNDRSFDLRQAILNEAVLNRPYK